MMMMMRKLNYINIYYEKEIAFMHRIFCVSQ
jgi:hypothetical protein